MYALLGRILVAVLGNSALTQSILTALGIPAQQDTLLGVATDSAISRSVLDWSDVSPGPLKTALIAIEADMATMSAAVLAAIAALPDGTSPVVLPSIPPTGYGGGTASDVWSYTLSPEGRDAADLLQDAGHLALATQSSGALVVAHSQFMQLEGAIGAGGYSYPTQNAIDLNPFDILADDDRLSWLERQWGSPIVWIYDAYNDNYYFKDAPPSSDLLWRCVVTREWFARLKATALGTVPGALVLPPLWPGLALVTLGTPVALSPGLTITEPMHGVLVELTSVPSVRGFYEYDDLKGWLNVGSLTFITDNGDAEPFQGLSFALAVYTPKSMAEAAGVKVRAGSGVAGTVTPWLTAP